MSAALLGRRLIAVLVLYLAGTASLTPPAAAHEVRPAYLEIRETAPGAYDILWKTPAQGNMRLNLDVVLPDACTSVTEPHTVLVEGAVVARWRETCSGGLVGREIGIANLDTTLTDAIVRFEPLGGAAKTLRLTADQTSAILPARQPWSEVAWTYSRLGVEHILLGFDHLLFVLALLLLVGDWRRLVGAISAFTLAHSLTLAGTTFGWISLAPAPVEAAIALSIVFLAAEILRARAGRPGLMQLWPWLAAFGFGLLHGFGFAGALREIGVPEDAAPLALLFFNIGVEAGQIVFILGVLAFLALWRRFASIAPAWSLPIPAYIIGTGASFWFIERTAAMLIP
ncbi:MAG: HupE/UreJ family protein [Alphaproteobacteria bacterium]|nr:HupE/UreJ family protein [Alphaproteobacteria bacterium]